MLALYHSWRSSASRRVRLCLAEKGLAYESHIVDMLKGDQHSPEYLAMNPNGMVPTLLHDGRVLFESSVIAAYLEETFPLPSIRPQDPYQRAVMRNFVRWIDEKCLPNLIVFNWSESMQPVASQWSAAELEQRLARVPSAERREAWTRVARKPYTDDEKTVAIRALLLLLDKMEVMLNDRSGANANRWLVGDAYSITDIAAAPFVMRISELNPTALAAHEHVADWWARVQARPAFAVARIESYSGSLRQEGAGVTPA